MPSRRASSRCLVPCCSIAPGGVGYARTNINEGPPLAGIAGSFATVLKSTDEESQGDVRPFNIVALFCGIGLVASPCMAALGLDVSGAIF
jgi:hypothetical protein